jgi:hypothetical protein
VRAAPWLAVGALLAAAALLGVRSARTAEVALAEVTHADGRYRVSFEARLAAEAGAVRALLFDYAHLDRLSPTVVASRLVPDPAGRGLGRLHLTQRACVLLFCRRLQRTMQVERGADGDTLTLVDGEENDFREAHERWQVVADGGAARVRFDAEYVPRFYVPPLVGPWLVRRHVLAALEDTAANAERLAHAP